MRLFWTIISTIYCYLLINKLIKTVPQFLFNKPKNKLCCIATEHILADYNFTINERNIIMEALLNLEYFCNGLIKITISFDLDPNDQNTIDSSILLKADGYHATIINADGYYQCKILGLCEYMTSGWCRLYLVSERLSNNIILRTTAIHELGHFIGLDHTDKPSIMHKVICNDVLFLTYKDAVELGRVWKIDPECFRYFKL